MEKKFRKKNPDKKIFEKKFKKQNGNKNLENKFKKKIDKKMYSNIDKCHIIFALLACFDKNRSNENVCGICTWHWFKIGDVARLHCTQGMWRFERSREKRYITACELSVTRLPHERYLLHRWYAARGLPPRWSAEHWVPQKSRMSKSRISCRTVLNSPVLIHRL